MKNLNEIFSTAMVLSAFDQARIKFLEEDIKEMERLIALKRAEIKKVIDKYRPKN